MLNFIGQKARMETGALIVRIDWWDIVTEEMPRICEKVVQHVDEGETSMMLACRSELVDMKKATKDDTSEKLTDALTGRKPKNLPQVFASFTKWSKTGLIGDATKASKAKGDKIMKAVVDNIISFLWQLDKLEDKLTE